MRIDRSGKLWLDNIVDEKNKIRFYNTHLSICQNWSCNGIECSICAEDGHPTFLINLISEMNKWNVT